MKKILSLFFSLAIILLPVSGLVATRAFAATNITTDPATAVTSTDATLNGTNGASAADGHSFWVSLATFSTASSTIPAGVYSTPDLGSIAANTPFSASLSSVTTTGVPTNLPAITPGTTYYFAAWSLVGGTWYPGDVLSFTTAPSTPACSGSSSFDSFNLGSVNTQGGWSATGPYDQAVVSNTYGYPTFGCQSLRVSDAITSGSFGDWIFENPLANAVGETSATAGTFTEGTRQNHFETQFDIASTQATQQPGLHLSVSPDRGDGSRMSYLRFEDQSDGIHVFFDDVTDAGPVGTTATFNESDIATISRSAHTIKLTLDTIDGPANDVVKVYIDNVLVHTGTSWEDYYRYDPEASAEQSPRIVKTMIIQARGTATPADQGKGFLFDNLTLSSSTVSPTANVTTNPATAITSTGATVNGTNGPSNATDTSFWLGTTSAGPFTPSTTPASQLPSGWNGIDSLAQLANAPFSYTYSSLIPNTQYYFVAWSLVGGTWYPGEVLSFTTASTTPPPTSSTVHIFKYIDGVQATIANANNVSFPMFTSTYNAPFTLGPAGWTTGDIAYEASTSPMAIGSSYSANENLNTSLVGSSCDGTHTYALVGYSTGDTLSQAENADPSLDIPSFTNLQGDKYIIVRNQTCTTTPPIKVHILKYLDGVEATATSANSYLFPMTATWSATNIGAGTGNYTLGNNFGGATSQYGADTAYMSVPADYTTSEITDSTTSQVVSTLAACTPGKYLLNGYRTSAVDFATTAAATLTATAPVFTGITTDQYVIVDNSKCPTTGTISGMKFNDLNRNGKKDAGEPGLSGWTIRLMLDNPITDEDTLIASVVTDANGNYTFSNVAPGTYDVRETHKKGWKRISKNPKDIVIVAGSVVDGVNFGNAVKHKNEREDTNNDDNRDDQSGKYYGNHEHSNYESDQGKKDHDHEDNSHNNKGH